MCGAICETRPLCGAQVLDNTYMRVLRNLDATDAGERLQRILRECFRNQAMLVVVETPQPGSNTAAYGFIEVLKGISCLHFIDGE